VVTNGTQAHIALDCPMPSGMRILYDPFWKGRYVATRRYQKYKPEFREQAARLVVDNRRAIAEVARELGVNETTLGNWVSKYREQHAEDEPELEVSERARLAELERRTRELEMENAFLKNAAAYFAKEQP
jgi:transposase